MHVMLAEHADAEHLHGWHPDPAVLEPVYDGSSLSDAAACPMLDADSPGVRSFIFYGYNLLLVRPSSAALVTSCYTFAALLLSKCRCRSC